MASGASTQHDREVIRSCVLVLSFALVTSALDTQAQDLPNPPPTLQTAGQNAEVPSRTTTPSESSSGKALIILLPESTPVKLRLLHPLNSKTVVEDDPLNFALAEDVVLNGKTVVMAGAVAIGRVRRAKAARMLGRGGQLELEMQYLKVGRSRVPLRGSQVRSGANKKGETVSLVVLFGLSGLVKHGSEIEVKEGSIFSAYVDKDTDLPQLESVVQSP
jgi:hypothetical protein